jgi:hypothetical protein
VLAPVLPELWQTPTGGWLMRSGALTIDIPRSAKGHDARHSYPGRDGGTHAFTLRFPTLQYSQKTKFTFQLGGADWYLELGKDRTDFSARVKKPQGAVTYPFEYETNGTSIVTNGSGNIAADDGTSLSRATMFRADGRAVPCSAWSIQGKTLSFTCDDSSFPKSAYPYIIDPSLSPGVASLQSCRTCNSSLGGCVNTCTPGSYISENEDDGQGWFHNTASWTMDTSSIPTNATVSSVLVSMVGGGGYHNYD